MADWQRITQPTLITSDIWVAENNMAYIADKLFDMGYEKPVIPPPVPPNNNTPIDQIANVLNHVESEIQNIHAVIDWVDEYYEEYEWSYLTKDKYDQVQRWFNWLNGIYKVISEVE